MSVAANWFQVWFDSPYYHKLYFDRDDTEREKFVGSLLNRLDPPKTARIAELGCARGKFSAFMASKGFDVSGIDLAPANIDAAKSLEKENLHFYQHDIRLPFWINFFDLAFNLFTNFGFYRTEHDHYNAIRTISQSLKKDGTFVLDYLNVHHHENNLVHKQEVEAGGVSFFITKWFDETHFFKKIVIEDDSLEEPLEYTEKLAKFSLGDFTDMLAFHHLQIQEVYGDYSFNSYDVNKSPRLLMIARKQ